MIKGIYAAASAMIANMNRQTLLSHNIANVDTPGYKTISNSLEDWIDTAVVPQMINSTSNSILSTKIPFLNSTTLRYLGDLGLGVETSPEVVDYQQGSFQSTGEAFDLAIQGDGMFHIETEAGERYTRDGRFLRDSAGNLVTSEGYFVLDAGGQRINLPEGEVYIDQIGRIQVGGEEIAQIGLVGFENLAKDVVREPSNLFAAVGEPIDASGTIQQGYLEMSNVNIAEMMTKMISVSRSYEAAQRMVTVQDSLLGRAISVLGKM